MKPNKQSKMKRYFNEPKSELKSEPTSKRSESTTNADVPFGSSKTDPARDICNFPAAVKKDAGKMKLGFYTLAEISEVDC
jgi:hypothetical protein